MAPSPEWIRAHERLSADITNVSKKAKLPFRSLPDLVNSTERYPELVPLLIDWLRTAEQKSGLTDARELGNFRDGLCRALTTIDAMGTDAVPVLFDQFYVEPRMPEVNLYAVGNALEYLAVPTDYERMANVAADRSLGSGRAAVLEWLIKQGSDDGLRIVVDQLDDPSVRALGVKFIRQFKPLPAGLRPVIEQYIDDPDSEVRKQAKATLNKLPA
ncbi:hypothetical protein QSJ19_03005 [Gordonia sp. ABSL11-1]|uniref:hypothetical protein n=1 Tax=Gordonia sp. ABSL11-1 TaxID=3053924 RepID=UPI002572DF36|nr:hypothetical protein [Gordonia sp. ABSL11-1]MDL9944568.1 hypothetical protein [Gordonia sp. ABSL11-1]